MSYRIRVADRFSRQSAEQLVTMAGAVITGLTNNPAFQLRLSTSRRCRLPQRT